MKIRLAAFADESCSALSGQIDALHRNRIGLLELRGVEGKNVTVLTDVEINRAAALLKAEGIEVWAIGSPLGKVDIPMDFTAYLETVKRTCEIACAFCCDKIRMFSFYNALAERERVLDCLHRMVEVGKTYGIRMCHENEKEIYGDSLKRNLDLLDHVEGLACVYDPANYLQVGETAENTRKALQDRALWFHIKDVIASTGELVPAGFGDCRVRELVSEIREDRVLTLEPHLAAFEGYSEFDRSALKNRFCFASNSEAFDAAAAALKKILAEEGYEEKEGGFLK